MFIVDSSIIVAAFREGESHFQDANDILEYVKEIIILDYILLEALTILKMREGKKIALDCLDFLTLSEHISVERLTSEEMGETLEFYREYDNKLSFVDAALLIVSKSRELSLITFDQELGKNFKWVMESLPLR